VDKWSDTSIAVHVPDGIESGYVFVRTKNGQSNTYPISVSRTMGKTWRGNAARYVLEHKNILYVMASLPEGRLVLFLPKPAETRNQSAETTIELGNEHLAADRESWQEYRFDHYNASQSKIEIVRRFLVDTSEISADINVNALSRGRIGTACVFRPLP